MTTRDNTSGERTEAGNGLDGIWEAVQVLSFDWRYLYLDDAAVRNGRQAREEMLGKTVMERYPGIEATEMFASSSPSAGSERVA